MPQTRDLRFKFDDSLVTFREQSCHISRLETLRNVLRAVGIPRIDMEQYGLIAPCLVVRWHQACDERDIVLNDSCLAPEFDPLPSREVDEEEVRLGVLGEIAGADELLVAAEVGKGDGIFVE